MRIPFTGVGTALITPFKKDGTLDESAVKRLARRQIDAGVHFLSPVGTTGEAPTLSDKEKLRVVELVAEEANGQVPILAGCGGYATREVIEMAREMEQAGATGLLSVVPYYNKPTQEGMYQHFKAIAQSTALPVVLYNVPSRTVVSLDVPTTGRLSEIPNIVGIKAPGDVEKMSELVSHTRDGFLVLSGDDPVAVATMAVGGAGVVSVASNEAPAEMVQIIELCEKGDFASARKLHHWLLPLIQVNFVESNPIPCKAAMAAMGLLDEVYRLPLVPPSQGARDKVMAVLQQLRLMGAAARAS
jgi:4-hydroxy-tetrahydrodipicolinate synthase